MAFLHGMFHGRPGRDVAHELAERPRFPYRHRGRRELREWKVEVRVAAVDQLPFRRPEAADALAVEAQEARIQLLVQFRHAVTDQRQQGAGPGDAPDLGMERGEVEPMGGLRGSHQACAAIGHGQVFGGGLGIPHAFGGGRMRELVGAGVEAEHGVEVRAELHRQLAGATADIDGEAGVGRGLRQEGGQCRRVLRAECGVVLSTSLEPVGGVITSFNGHAFLPG